MYISFFPPSQFPLLFMHFGRKSIFWGDPLFNLRHRKPKLNIFKFEFLLTTLKLYIFIANTITDSVSLLPIFLVNKSKWTEYFQTVLRIVKVLSMFKQRNTHLGGPHQFNFYHFTVLESMIVKWFLIFLLVDIYIFCNIYIRPHSTPTLNIVAYV